MILLYHLAFYCGLYGNKHSSTSGNIDAFTKFPSRASAAARPLLFSPPASPKLQAQPTISADPSWREPGIQLLFPRVRNPPARRGEASGGRGASEATPPAPARASGPGGPGRGEQSGGRTRGTAAGTICPSARCSAAPAPTSTRLSDRRLAKGFPRRAPQANRRRAGGARGPLTRTFQN